MLRVVELTSYLYLHLPSSPSLGQRRRDQTWQNSEEDAGIPRQCRQRGRHGHDHFACGSESLNSTESVELSVRRGSSFNQISRIGHGSRRKQASGVRKMESDS